jgi:dihydrofolate synthase/folylpolyglutamate synthase
VSDDQGRAQPPADPLALSDASLTSWLAHLESLHPSGQCGIELGLERVLRVKDVLSQDLQCPVITVGGTNGKGSTCAYLEAMYSFAGYRVGCYTSPHLLEYNERVRIGRLPVDDAGLCEAFARVEAARQAAGGIALTYFEFGTLAAIEVFRSRQVEVLILEVGLGGRLDAVNAYDADCAVVTSIALDHTDWLGPTRERRSLSKKPASFAPADQRSAPTPTRLPVPARTGADDRRRSAPAGARFRSISATQLQWTFWTRGGRRRGGLANPGLARRRPVAQCLLLRLTVIELLRDRGCRFPMQAIRRGLIDLDLRGRFQLIPGRPTIVLDVAHNPQAVAGLADKLGDLAFSAQTIAVLGMLGDKDIAGSLAPLAGKVDHWLLADLEVPRGASSAVLAASVHGAALGGSVEQFASPAEAFARSAELAGENDRILVFGSFYTVAAVMRSMQNGR